jgi:hypothetical protein
MRNVNSVITLEQLAQDFTSLFRYRTFRLETLDWYDAPNEHEPYARFLAGEPVDPAWRRPWQRLVRGVRESGRSMERVHVVSEPVSAYVRFSLLHGYPASVEAGEDVRILGRARATGLPDSDYWLFDDDLAAILVYDDAGKVERVELDRSPFTLARLGAARDRAMRLAVPLAQYKAEHEISRRRA